MANARDTGETMTGQLDSAKGNGQKNANQSSTMKLNNIQRKRKRGKLHNAKQEGKKKDPATRDF